jgi:hypothetical protein
LRATTLLLAMLVLVLAGCSASAASLPAANAVRSLHVARTSAFAQNHIPPFDRTLTDATKAQQIYQAMVRLPAYPTDVGTACPASIGVAYQLTFTLSNKSTLRATAEPDSCPTVYIGANDVRAAFGESFWNLLADTLGLPRADVLPKPSTSGPSAPTPLPTV